MSICMGKKNTLLYLDENLVKEAKKSNLNISKISENAIKHYLFASYSIGKRASIDYGQYLVTLKEEKRCFFLPFPLDEVELYSIGIIDGLKTKFSQFTVFVGNHGTGKTTVVRSIVHMLGFSEPNIERLLKNNAPMGSICLNVSFEEPLTLKLTRGKHGEIIKEEKIGCIVLDDPGEEFDDKNYYNFIRYLKGLDTQIIMTSRVRFDPDSKVIDMNIFLKKK